MFRISLVLVVAPLLMMAAPAVAQQDTNNALRTLSTSKPGSGRESFESAITLLKKQLPVGDSPEARALLAIVEDENRPSEVRIRCLELVIQKSDAASVSVILPSIGRIAGSVGLGDETRRQIPMQLMNAFVRQSSVAPVSWNFAKSPLVLPVIGLILKNRLISAECGPSLFELFECCSAPAAEKSAVAVQYILSIPFDHDFPREILTAVDEKGIIELRSAVAKNSEDERVFCGASTALADLGDEMTLPLLERSESHLTGATSKRLLRMYKWRIRVQKSPDSLLAAIADDDEFSEPLWAFYRAHELGLSADQIAAAAARRIAATKPLEKCSTSREKNFFNGTELLRSGMESFAQKMERAKVNAPTSAPTDTRTGRK